MRCPADSVRVRLQPYYPCIYILSTVPPPSSRLHRPPTPTMIPPNRLPPPGFPLLRHIPAARACCTREYFVEYYHGRVGVLGIFHGSVPYISVHCVIATLRPDNRKPYVNFIIGNVTTDVYLTVHTDKKKTSEPRTLTPVSATPYHRDARYHPVVAVFDTVPGRTTKPIVMKMRYHRKTAKTRSGGYSRNALSRTIYMYIIK